MLLLSVVKV